MITDSELLELERLIDIERIEAAKTNLLDSTKYTFPKFQSTWFHENYYRILDLFAKGKIKKLIISEPPQHGKAIQVDTPVLTTKGWKRHGDLIPGDFVFGEKGYPVMVTHNHGSHLNESSAVYFSGGERIIASNKHEWKVLCDREKYRGHGRKSEILETSELLVKQRRNPAINAKIELCLEFKDLPIDPYVLGCWLGDGDSDGGKLTCGTEDINHFSFLGKTKFVSRNNYYQIRIDGLSRKLRLCNLVKNKHIPESYILSSFDQRLELLRGLMDTDGTVDAKGRCEFTQKSDNGLANDVYILMRSLGLKPVRATYPMKINGRTVGLKDRIFVSKPHVRIFNLKRKYDRQQYSTRIDSTRFFIEQVENVGLQEVNCITVEGGLYLCGEQLILTHNSQGSSVQLPAYMIGRNPDLKIATVCYSATKARKFGRKVKQLMSDESYRKIYSSRLAEMGDSNYINTAEEMEIVGHDGSLKCVGYKGGLTGDPVDVLLMDDLYKDWQEASSPLIRENVKAWYISVADARLHNDSQQLIVFTRWNNDDLVGFIEANDEVELIESWSQLENPDPKKWYKVNFPAIKTGEPTEIDPRAKGEPLWPERHSLDKLLKSRAKDPLKFECLYQGNPTAAAGLLWGTEGWKTYQTLPDAIVRKNYTDTADRGTDYLCSIDYDVCEDGLAYVVDVRYTTEPMEVTEPLVAGGLLKNKVKYSDIESNNGGRSFARKIDEMTRHMCTVSWFHQSANKEARIVSNAATVKQSIVFPDDWHLRWPEFYLHVVNFKRKFNANQHDDCADTLTGIIEKKDEIQTDSLIISPFDL